MWVLRWECRTCGAWYGVLGLGCSVWGATFGGRCLGCFRRGVRAGRVSWGRPVEPEAPANLLRLSVVGPLPYGRGSQDRGDDALHDRRDKISRELATDEVLPGSHVKAALDANRWSKQVKRAIRRKRAIPTIRTKRRTQAIHTTGELTRRTTDRRADGADNTDDGCDAAIGHAGGCVIPFSHRRLQDRRVCCRRSPTCRRRRRACGRSSFRTRRGRRRRFVRRRSAPRPGRSRFGSI